jgi:hypothetical protein
MQKQILRSAYPTHNQVAYGSPGHAELRMTASCGVAQRTTEVVLFQGHSCNEFWDMQQSHRQSRSYLESWSEEQLQVPSTFPSLRSGFGRDDKARSFVRARRLSCGDERGSDGAQADQLAVLRSTLTL